MTYKVTELIYNARVITPWRVLENGWVLWEDGKIKNVGAGCEFPAADKVTDAENDYVTPGFIDIHTHGGGGHDFMDAEPEGFIAAARAHLEHGTTTIVPTTVSSTNEKLLPVLRAFDEAKKLEEEGKNNGATLWGLHLEGPYFNLENRGAMDPRYVRDPDPAEIAETLASSDHIVRWSVAPELPGAKEMGRMLYERGIVASIGHTMAVYDETLAAVENGYTLCTHLYSAMPGVRRINAFRHAGVIEAAFATEGLDVEIIADGCHLPQSLLKLIYKEKGAAHVALITDSMRAAGQDVTESILGGKDGGLPVIVEDGVAKLPDRTAFAGSIATADRLIRVMCSLSGAPIEDVIRMITETPARIMGMKNKGRLACGFDADIVRFDDDIKVKTVIKGGKTEFSL
ncbi:MAG: N-acetylglucosamine-6-phosphate deacetylase [Clostridia bacterium]|nr:N-acetylglucosamine-6-phosphate deacetylase [Clostridia bacterium]